MFSKILFLVLVLCCALISAQHHIYIRHKRSVERENDSSVPTKESTVVVQGNNTNAVNDMENEIASHEKDCKDFFEVDYNPFNDSLLFSGKIPTFSHNRNLNSLEEMLHQMLSHTSNMFHNFPIMPNNNYPDNYNGTVEEQVIIDGKKFLKKQHIVNKSTGGSKISIMSTIYEPVEDDNSTTGTGQVGGETNPNNETSTVRGDLTDGKIISY